MASSETRQELLELFDHLRTFWTHRFLIIGGTAAALLVALVWSLTITPVYESQVTVLVTPSLAEGDGNTPDRQWSVETFRSFLTNKSVFQQVVAEFDLDQRSPAISAASLARRVRAEEVRGTRLLRATVSLPEAQLAADVANRLAELTASLSRDLDSQIASRSREFLAGLVDDARERMEQKANALLEYQSSAQVELLEADVDSLVRMRSSLANLLVDIEEEKALIASAQEELARHERLTSLMRYGGTDLDALERVRAGEQGSAANAADLQILEETVNPVYESLQQRIAVSTTRLAGLESRKAEIIDRLGVDADALDEINALNEHRVWLARLEMEHKLAQDTYRDLSALLEETHLEVAHRSPQLMVVDPAVPPDRPVVPRMRLNLMVGAVVGFLAAVFFAMLLDYVGRTQRRRASEAT